METEGEENRLVSCMNRHMMSSYTSKDVHVSVRSVWVVQHAKQPYDDHGVDEKDVAHVLIQVEVLQEEPEF